MITSKNNNDKQTSKQWTTKKSKKNLNSSSTLETPTCMTCFAAQFSNQEETLIWIPMVFQLKVRVNELDKESIKSEFYPGFL